MWQIIFKQIFGVYLLNTEHSGCRLRMLEGGSPVNVSLISQWWLVPDYHPQASDSTWMLWGRENGWAGIYIYFLNLEKSYWHLSPMKRSHVLEKRGRVILYLPLPVRHQQGLAAYEAPWSKCCSQTLLAVLLIKQVICLFYTWRNRNRENKLLAHAHMASAAFKTVCIKKFPGKSNSAFKRY